MLSISYLAYSCMLNKKIDKYCSRMWLTKWTILRLTKEVSLTDTCITQLGNICDNPTDQINLVASSSLRYISITHQSYYFPPHVPPIHPHPGIICAIVIHPHASQLQFNCILIVIIGYIQHTISLHILKIFSHRKFLSVLSPTPPAHFTQYIN